MSYERIEHAGGAGITSLTAAITSGDTTCAIADGIGWPDGTVGPFYISIFEQVGDNRVNEEKIQVTSRTSLALAGLLRGADNTTAVDHVSGSTVEHVFTAIEADEANAVANATLGQVVAKGDLLIGSNAEELTIVSVGADGDNLVADSSQPGGVSWSPLPPISSITAGAVGTTELADNSVTLAKLADDSVTAAKIIDGSVGTAELATSAVTTAKIADRAITSVKIGQRAVDTYNIATGAVTSAQIAAGAVNNGALDLGFWWYGAFDAYTDTGGEAVLSHDAPFTPNVALIQMTSPSSGANFILPCVTALGASTFTLQFRVIQGTSNTVHVQGYALLLP